MRRDAVRQRLPQLFRLRSYCTQTHSASRIELGGTECSTRLYAHRVTAWRTISVIEKNQSCLRCQRLGTSQTSMSADVVNIAKVVVPLFACGLLTAYIFPSDRLHGPWSFVSDAMGFSYTAAWSISFYPQFLLNLKRRSIVGLSIDFQVLNLLGFFCYATYNVALFFVPAVQHQYHAAFGPELPVGLEDVLFSVHAFVITALTLLQCAVYERGEQRFNTLNAKLAAGVAGAAAAACAVVAVSQSQEKPVPNLTWLNLLLVLSAVKLEVLLNFNRKSTEGWSIMNVLLDWLGGVLSVAQIIMQCAVSDDWRQIAGNPVKFGLGFVSLSFDVVFMVQHYVLYASDSQNVGESAPDAINLLSEKVDDLN